MWRNALMEAGSGKKRLAPRDSRRSFFSVSWVSVHGISACELDGICVLVVWSPGFVAASVTFRMGLLGFHPPELFDGLPLNSTWVQAQKHIFMVFREHWATGAVGQSGVVFQWLAEPSKFGFALVGLYWC